MTFSALFISRPIATTLLTLAVSLAGILAYFLLPVAPLPQVDFPIISVNAAMPGASPEVMASSVITPLERHLGQIADVGEMTSTSNLGTGRITLLFGLNRDINGAARDVQAAINASFADLPSSLKSYPTYRKLNPSDRPILIFSLKSKTLTVGQIYDLAATILAQKVSQVDGVGNVTVGGSSLPAVRVELQPLSLYKYGIGYEDIRAALASANANSPKGAIESETTHFQIYTNDQANHADQYRQLVVAYRNNRPVFLNDIAEVSDSVEDIRNIGFSNGEPAVLLFIYREPNANIIEVADHIKSMIPYLQSTLPPSVSLTLAIDRTITIRGSLHDVEFTLLISLTLVILVVYLFLGTIRATIIPAIAIPVSIIGTFGVMYFLGYSLNNLSMMALTVSTGFVVDDAIVVLENVTRHMEAGMNRLNASLKAIQEVSFTVISMSLSLVAVFIPILLMGGLIGRIFREFTVTLAVAILISLLVSLTTTPMMCASLLPKKRQYHHKFSQWSDRTFNQLKQFYEITLKAALHHPRVTLVILFITIILNIYLYVLIPKGFIPQQDTGAIIGNIQGDQSISFQFMKEKIKNLMAIVQADPAVENITGFTGGGGFLGGSVNSGFVFASLKPISERKISADEVITRLRGQLNSVAGATLYLQAAQDIVAGGRSGNAQYQYTLEADTLENLRLWTPRLAEALKKSSLIKDVSTDQQEGGLETNLIIDRSSLSRFGLTSSQINNTLYDAYGQRQVSTIYNAVNQYHVIMGVAPQFWQSPSSLETLYISSNGGIISGTQSSNFVSGTYRSSQLSPSFQTIAADTSRNAATNSIAKSGRSSTSTGSSVSTGVEKMIPLSAVAHFEENKTALSVNHQGHFPAATISFNLLPGKSLSDAVQVIKEASETIGLPKSVQGDFAGTAKIFTKSLSNQPFLVLAAFITVYVVLGILYESYIHPITILSTLPSAGIGALVALLSTNTEFSLIALIGIILLIGIVKKNAIMMIDVALVLEREQGKSSKEAIFEACLLRFRPIMMTTMVALLGALPLAIGHGDGAEVRRPLGISIMGGLIFSQILTLYTTPVIYIYMDRLRSWGILKSSILMRKLSFFSRLDKSS